ncbi:Uncharacterized protein QTN25_000680 [Entamoeba marina]
MSSQNNISIYESHRNQIEYSIESSKSGFCDNGGLMFVGQKKKVSLYCKQSSIPTDEIECDSNVTCAVASNTTSGNVLFIATSESLQVVKFEETITSHTIQIKGIVSMFDNICYSKNPLYHYVIFATQPFSIQMLRVKNNAVSYTTISKFHTIQDFESSKDDIALINLSYSTFTPKPSFLSPQSTKPFIETSSSGRFPFTNYQYLDTFIPTFISIHLAGGRPIVLVGGKSGLCFVYDPSEPHLLFSIQFQKCERLAIETIFFHYDVEDIEKGYMKVILCGDRTTTVLFYSFDKNIGLKYLNLHVLDNKQYLYSAHPSELNNTTMILTYDITPNSIEMWTYDAKGYLISNTNYNIEMSKPLCVVDKSKVLYETSSIYEQSLPKCPKFFIPFEINVVTDKEWFGLCCSNELAEIFEQSIRLLPPIVLNNSNKAMISFYNNAISRGFNFPEINCEQKELIKDAFNFLIEIGHHDLILEELNEIEQGSDLEIIALEFFKIYYDDLSYSFTNRATLHTHTINTRVLERIESAFIVCKKAFILLNAEQHIHDRIKQNIYALRYFRSIGEFIEQLSHPAVMNVNGTLVNPILGLINDGSSYPFPLGLLIVHLFTHPIYPVFQIYLHYLFIIHGLSDYINFIPTFNNIPQIDVVPQLLVAFDSQQYDYFFKSLKENKELNEAFVTDVLPTVFNYYSNTFVSKPLNEINKLEKLVNNIELLDHFVKYLVASEQFAKAIDVICDYHLQQKSPNTVFWDFIQKLFGDVILQGKIDLFLKTTYNTQWEHHFMVFVVETQNFDPILSLLKHYCRVGDIYSATLVFVMAMSVFPKTTENGAVLITNFQSFVNGRSDSDQKHILDLMNDKKQLTLFFNTDLPLTLKQASNLRLSK